MRLSDFFVIYSPKRLWRKLWFSVANLPMFPQTRARVLRWGGVNIEGRAIIYGGVGIDSVAPNMIYIGEGTAITSGTKILTHYLNTSIPKNKGNYFRFGEVHIGRNCFIGVNCVICNSVTIGDGAIIGAGSVVTKDIPPYQVWAGNPAHFIKDREKE